MSRLVKEQSARDRISKLYSYSINFFNSGLNLPILMVLTSRQVISGFLRLVYSIMRLTSPKTTLFMDFNFSKVGLS